MRSIFGRGESPSEGIAPPDVLAALRASTSPPGR
jgi:hypothetical protein